MVHVFITYDAHQLIARVAPSQLGKDGGDDAELVQAVALIIGQRHESIDINLLASSLAISRRTLERRFRERLGISVRRFCTLLRLEIAKDALLQTELSITAVSVEAGFSSPARMSNVFRRELNCSPRQFRKNERAEAAPERQSPPADDRETNPRPPIVECTQEWGTAVGESHIVVAMGEVSPQKTDITPKN